jgi:hypothetical protein
MALFSSWLYVSMSNPILSEQFQHKTSNRIKWLIGTPNTQMGDRLLSWLSTVTSIKIGTGFILHLVQRCIQASVNVRAWLYFLPGYT